MFFFCGVKTMLNRFHPRPFPFQMVPLQGTFVHFRCELRLLRLLLGVGGLLGASMLQLTAPPLVSSALMAAEKGAKFAQAELENFIGGGFWFLGISGGKTGGFVFEHFFFFSWKIMKNSCWNMCERKGLKWKLRKEDVILKCLQWACLFLGES